MKNLEKYIDIAKKAELKSTPFSNKEFRELIESSKGAGTGKSINKSLSKTGSITAMTTISIIVAFVAAYFFGVFSPKTESDTQPVSQNQVQERSSETKETTPNIKPTETQQTNRSEINTPEIPDIKTGRDKSRLVPKDEGKSERFDTKLIAFADIEQEPSVEGGTIKAVKRVPDIREEDLKNTDDSVVYKVPWKCKREGYIHRYVDSKGDILWLDRPYIDSLKSENMHREHLVFNSSNMDIRAVIRYRFIDSSYWDLKYSRGSFTRSCKIEDKDLIRIMKEIEDEVNDEEEIDKMKELSHVDYGDFFIYLNEYIYDSITDNNRRDALKMYAYIFRKLTNERNRYYDNTTHGLILPRENLDKLGIRIGKNYISFPADEYIRADKKIANSYFFTPELRKAGYRKRAGHDRILFKNHTAVWGWGKNTTNKSDSLLISNWVRSSSYIEPEEYSIDGLVLAYKTDYLPQDYGENARKTVPVVLAGVSYIDLRLAPIHTISAPLIKEIGKTANIIEDLQDKRDSFMGLFSGNKDLIKKDLDFYQSYYQDKTTELKYSKLVPVRIQTPYYDWSVEKQKDRMGDYSFTIAWYYPNKEFLSALPDDIRYQLEEEMELVEKVKTGEIAPQAACDSLGERESILGLCSIKPPVVVDIVAAPNPASGRAEITFNLKEERYLKLLLLDSQGNYVKDFNEWDLHSPGRKTYTGNFSELSNGSYMLVIVTEQGEKYLKKILIEK